MRATSHNNEVFDYYDRYFYEVNDLLEKYNNTKIWPTLGTKNNTD